MIINIKSLKTSDYKYDLPVDQIAYTPVEKRGISKILIYNQGKIHTNTYENIADEIPLNAFMVFNNTLVVEARLLFQKATGGVIEIFCLEPHEMYSDITTAMQQIKKVQWKCLIGGASKWKKGQVLKKEIFTKTGAVTLTANYVEKITDAFVIELSWDNNQTFAEILHLAGKMPLPPYIKREVTNEDSIRYQTVYGKTTGSVAAPTAGLHFTDEILDTLKRKNIITDFITLHVGAGTFKPVTSNAIADHEMHGEYIEITASMITKLLDHSGEPVIAVGTTSMRTLETLYWLGCKLLNNENCFDDTLPEILQWEVYKEISEFPVRAALEKLLLYTNNHSDKLIAKTQIMIVPGYTFKITNALITNFHQPGSTLLLLVAAFIGEDWRKVYAYALQNDFKFLSYGDGSLLWRKRGYNPDDAVSDTTGDDSSTVVG